MNTKIKAGPLALAVSCALFACAATAMNGDNVTSSIAVGELSSAPYSDTFSHLSSSNQRFSDTFSFTIGTESTFTATLQNFFLSYPIIKGFDVTLLDIKNLKATLWSDSDVATLTAKKGITTLSAEDSYSSILSAGDYHFTVTGKTIGFIGGAYSLTMNAVPTAPIPEPESYAMLLAGLGLMGTIAHRRRKNSA